MLFSLQNQFNVEFQNLIFIVINCGKKMGKRKGKSLKKNHVFDESESPETLNAPHSFVIHRGLPFPNITYLTMDFRRMMEPFTASSLRERRKNKLKDFVSLSGVFHVSHMVVFNKSENQLSFKVARLPKGPTLNFKIHQFTLARDVLSSMKKQYYNDTEFKYPPLVIYTNDINILFFSMCVCVLM